MRTTGELRELLHRIDGRGYKAYKEIAGGYVNADGVELHVDHVQGDPFAAPSRVRVRVPMDVAELPVDLWKRTICRVALEDALARKVAGSIRDAGSRSAGSGKSGRVFVDAGGQEVLERSAVRVTPRWVEARLEVGLPAAGRRVLGRAAATLLCDDVLEIARRGLCWEQLDCGAVDRFVDCVENWHALGEQLREHGLVAFVADGAILPRASGADDRPMARGAVPFRVPDELRVTLELPRPPVGDGDGDGPRRITGLGVPEGVTLIVGGGYHGKSTLLRALERGVYPHVPGDGRERVVTRADAVKVRAEDGRRVERVDIAGFISELPGGRDTRAFSSDDASGSTSQAASIVEALELGASVLLLDEDTSATNFMVRDARMQALVHSDDEPITPFVDRVAELYQQHGVSSVLVMGGSGDYFDAATTVIRMKGYVPADVSARAAQIAREQPTRRQRECPAPLGRVASRVPEARSVDASKGRREVKVGARGTDTIVFGEHDIDVRLVEQLVDESQVRAAGHALHLARRFMEGDATLHEVLDALEERFDSEGVDVLSPRFDRQPDHHPGNLARPRRFEIAAALNRLRTLRVRQLRS